MTPELHVVFRPDGTALAALPVRHVLETMRPLRIEPLAGTPSFVAGAAIVRGRVVPVIDARALFGGDDAEPTRWISFAVGDRAAVLAVRAVLGVRPLDLGAGEKAPPLLTKSAHGAIEQLVSLDGELLAVLRTTRLVGDDVWRAAQSAASLSAREALSLRPEARNAR